MKTRVGVFFGGRTVEHEVSVVSALQAVRQMDSEKYEVIPVYISKSGTLYTGSILLEIERYKDIPALLHGCIPVGLGAQDGILQLCRSRGFGGKIVAECDAAFPIVHGTNVEDGALQGVFELLNVPYVGSSVLSSAVSMDKCVTKLILRDAGLPVLDFVSFQSRDWNTDRELLIRRIESEMSYPVIVKPANLGSSIGIKKAADRGELLEAVDLAKSFSRKILVEPAIENLREINCSVCGEGADLAASVCEEPISHDEILSYADKYTSGDAAKGMSGQKRRIPADLTPERTAEIRQLALDTFAALECSGVARIDFMIDTASDTVYVNEINPIPGSLAFYLWEAADLPYPKLIDRLIKNAFRRKQDRRDLIYTYDSNILAMGGGLKGIKK